MIFGRDHELAALHAAYTNMLAGYGSVLFLTGEAGLGKTTLVHTWAAGRDAQITSEHQTTNQDSQPTTLFLESACSIPIGNVDVGRLEALQPWADVVAQLHEKLSTQSTSKGKSQHKLNLGKLMRDSAPAWLWALPFVGEVAHAALVTARLAKDQRTGTKSQVHSPTGPDPSLDERQFAAANQEQVFQQYVNLLTKISSETPLVIFLDDLHWADTSSCNLLFYLARQIGGKKILVIATYRQDDATSANEGKGHAIITVKNEILRYSTGSELALSYLNRDAIRAFIEGTFAGYFADEKFERWLHKISDGNSLFMTQFVKTLREDGHLDDSGKFVGDYASVVIPTSALAVVEERTRRLDTDTRELLMYATAEGEEFTTYVLERLTKKEPMELLKELRSATITGLIVQRGTGRLYANTTTGIFGFSHALFHKALYDSLLEMQKQHLHHQCFQLLKAEWDRLADNKQRTTTHATKLLAHAEKCEEWTTVAEVALTAGQEFWKAFNEDEALVMIASVLTVSAVSEGLSAQRAEALYLRGEINYLRGRNDEALNDYRAAELLFKLADNAVRAVDAVNGLALTCEQTASYDAALDEATRALEQALAVGYRRGEAAALNCIGHVHDSHSDYDAALRVYSQSLLIMRAIPDGRGEAAALNNIGWVHYVRGAYDEALSYYEGSLVIDTTISNRKGEAITLMNIGSVRQALGDYDDALSYCERSLAIHTAIGSSLGEAEALNRIGWVHAARGAYDEALSYSERSLVIFTAIGDRRGESDALHSIGRVHADQGAYDEALSCFERSLVINNAINSRHREASALNNIGQVHRDQCHNDEALANYTRSLAIYTDIGDRRGEGSVLHNIGNVLNSQGDNVEALSYFERSLVIFAAIGDRRFEANSLEGIGNVHTYLGAYDEALSHYERSLRVRSDTSDRRGEALSLHNIGCVLRLSGKIPEARDYLHQALTVATAIATRALAAETIAELGLLAEDEARTLEGLERVAKLADARRLVKEAIVMYRELKNDSEIEKWEKELERIKASA